MITTIEGYVEMVSQTDYRNNGKTSVTNTSIRTLMMAMMNNGIP